jgi:hypothetical protein
MKKMPPQADTFLTSKYFRTFINIATFFQRVSLPKPEKFIWLMVQKDFPPTMWMLDEVYALFIEFLEYHTTPMEQVQLSIDTLFDEAEKRDVDVSEVFSKIHATELIQLVRCRRVSPWLLLHSKRFKQYFVERMTSEQRMILESLIMPERWAERFEKNSKVVDTIKQCIRELNL